MNGEIKMTTDLTLVGQQKLEFNYTELKEFLSAELEQYRTMVVTEEAIPEAKAIRAKLNKLTKDLNDYRISVKKVIMAQYEEDFAPKMTELAGMAKDASNTIDEQIKAFEERDKKQKIEALHAQYDAMADAEIVLYCPWEYIYNPKWENKGYSADDAIAEIKMSFETTKRAINTIREMGGMDAAYLLDTYRQTHDLAAVMQKMTDLKNTREQEAQRQQEAAEQPKVETVVESVEQRREKAQQAKMMRTVDFRVVATEIQLQSLATFMRANGIKYGRVPEVPHD